MRRDGVISFVLLILVTACTPISQLFAPMQPTLTPEPLFVPTETITSTPDSVGVQRPCFYVWASKERPDLSQQIQTAFDTNGLTGVTVLVSDYGENCVSSETNKVQSFFAMMTDFRMTAAVDNLDADTLDAQAFNIMTVLKDAWSGGPTGNVILLFTSDAGETTVQGPYTVWMDMLAQHPDGKNLLSECSSVETGSNTRMVTCSQ